MRPAKGTFRIAYPESAVEHLARLTARQRTTVRHTLVVTRGGRPIAALMPISTAADIETFKVSRSPRFQALIAESRRVNPPGTGLTTAQVRRALAARRSRRVRP